jgi:hypothetical protein
MVRAFDRRTGGLQYRFGSSLEIALHGQDQNRRRRHQEQIV